MTAQQRMLLSLVALAGLTAGCGSTSSDGADSTAASWSAAAPVTSPAPTPTPAPTPAPAPTTPPAAGDTTPGTLAPTVPPAPTAAPTTTNLDDVQVVLTEIGSFDQPLAMTVRLGDEGTLLLGERSGVVRAISDEDDIELLDISEATEAEGERGLLGLAASPDGRFLYVSSTRNDGTSAIDEYAFTEDGGLDASSRRVVLELEQPYPNHNGGHIAFGADGLLYVGTGDGGSANDPDRRALKLDTLLGKMLRIDPSTPSGDLGYTIPTDNPFVGVDGARAELWSIGLRNPWRYSFDRVTGDLWIGDVGQNEWEEVDVATAASGGGRGVNFGWSAFEGNQRFNDDQLADGHQPPIHEYSHSSGDGNSITGGFVYRGSAIPDLYGAYVFGDYETGNIWAITSNPDGSLASGPVKIAERSALASFGEDADGELYVLSLDGPVYRLDQG